MIKPIIYHSFEEKEKLEKELMAQIPFRKRKAVAKELMTIFYNAPREQSSANSSKVSDEMQEKRAQVCLIHRSKQLYAS